MFKIESYITPILLSYVEKYVKDFKPDNAQVSLWAGGVALHNLVLKTDVLQKELSLPFSLVSGRIHELLIQVPWTKIMSEPIVISIDTIECVLGFLPPKDYASTSDNPPAPKPPEVEAPPGYMQALVRRIFSNITLKIHHLIVKYVEDDIVLSLNVKQLSIESADAKWEPAYADIDVDFPVIRRLVTLDDLTLCLDQSDSDGKIRYFQEPVLYRCQVSLRLLSKLASVNTRRATNLYIQVHTSQLAWGLTTDQACLIMRLHRHLQEARQEMPTLHVVKEPSSSDVSAHLSPTQSVSDAPVKDSWSEWAWSWLPAWSDHRDSVEELPPEAVPFPLHFTAYINKTTFLFKIMELDASSKKKTRGVLELVVQNTAIVGLLIKPTKLEVTIGIRTLTLQSYGKCVCGHEYEKGQSDDSTAAYFSTMINSNEETPWDWPAWTKQEPIIKPGYGHPAFKINKDNIASQSSKATTSQSAEPSVEVFAQNLDSVEFPKESDENTNIKYDNEMFHSMNPVVYIAFKHERMPPLADENPFNNPPKDFEYSDWVENCITNVRIQPVDLILSMGLIHRLAVFTYLPEEIHPRRRREIIVNKLTVEECDALIENLPQRRIEIEVIGPRIRIFPWEHSVRERIFRATLILHVLISKANIHLNMPLYPVRVCSAVCQIPQEQPVLWQGARFHTTIAVESLQVHLVSLSEQENKPSLPVARVEFRLVMHQLMLPALFPSQSTELMSYSFRMQEFNVCGSQARLLAAYSIALSLWQQRLSALLRFTSLATDALADEEHGAIDVTFELTILRGFISRNVNMHILKITCIRIMIFKTADDKTLKQAWLFAGPDTPSQTAYLRLAVQWCNEMTSNSLDYLGLWLEPTAVCADPLFVTWLAYEPQLIGRPAAAPSETSRSNNTIRTTLSSQFLIKKRVTASSSSGRGQSRSGTELVHSTRARSQGSSEPTDTKEQPQPATKPHTSWWTPEYMIPLHQRMRHLLLQVELGLVLVYVTLETASAVDTVTIREAVERHAINNKTVICLSLGRIEIACRDAMAVLWQAVVSDAPTYIDRDLDKEKSYPWKLVFSDVSCYLLELKGSSERSTLKTQLKAPCVVIPCQIIEMFTTSVTLSVVTKAVVTLTAPPTKRSKKEEKKSKISPSEEQVNESVQVGPSMDEDIAVNITNNTSHSQVVALGVNVYADTPPIMVKVDQDQVHSVVACFHGLGHILRLLQRESVLKKRAMSVYTRVHIASLLEADESINNNMQDEDDSLESESELMTIYENDRLEGQSKNQTTFFWFQWVISRATIVVASDQIRLALNIDDIISTIDIQSHYNQLKVKITSAFIRYYEKHADDSEPAAFGGHVLEAQELTSGKEEDNFLAVTITQAQLSNLPSSWKMEMDPKVLQASAVQDTMWEVYATMAPLELSLHPTVVVNIIQLMKEVIISSRCPFKDDKPHNALNTFQWPYFYVVAGGLNIILPSNEPSETQDDAFVIMIRKITINPHPENPICRRSHSAIDASWLPSSGALEGRQYEVFIKNFEIYSTRFENICEIQKKRTTSQAPRTSENPALKWNQQSDLSTITSILQSMEISCILAPPLYISGMLVSGSALELNLNTDCTFEVSLQQLDLINEMIQQYKTAFAEMEEISTYQEAHSICPYADLWKTKPVQCNTETSCETKLEEAQASKQGNDSGVNSLSNMATSIPKRISYGCLNENEPSVYTELFITTGIIELTFYTRDDNSPRLAILRPPNKRNDLVRDPNVSSLQKQPSEVPKRDNKVVTDSHSSITEIARETDVGQTQLHSGNQASKSPGMIVLMYIRLKQPNVYFWKKKSQRNLQVSLFDAHVILGAAVRLNSWHVPVVTTAPGRPDPKTDVPPALACMKVHLDSSSSNSYGMPGSLTLDVDRPVQFRISKDCLRRLKLIGELVGESCVKFRPEAHKDVRTDPALYRFAKLLGDNTLETVLIKTTQLSVSTSLGLCSCVGISLQVAVAPRSDAVVMRGLLNSICVSIGTPSDLRHVLTPLTLGVYFQGTWEKWRAVENVLHPKHPTTKLTVDLDHVVIEFRPDDAATLTTILQDINEIVKEMTGQKVSKLKISPNIANTRKKVTEEELEQQKQYYKDDLRTGAFKIMTGNELPLTYQIKLCDGCISWCYPHPRSVNKIMVYPIPSQETPFECVLEHYNTLLDLWEPHVYMTTTPTEVNEVTLLSDPPDGIFAVTWRFRAIETRDIAYAPFAFSSQSYTPRKDPFVTEEGSQSLPATFTDVSAELLLGALRVDTVFSPLQLSLLVATCRVAAFKIYFHNSNLKLSNNQTELLEGYYLSKPLRKSHRAIGFILLDFLANAQYNVNFGGLLLINTSATVECVVGTTGTMNQIVENCRIQSALSYPLHSKERLRLVASTVVVALNSVNVKTLESLFDDWKDKIKLNEAKPLVTISRDKNYDSQLAKHELASQTGTLLDGRVALWLHNSSSSALRISQEATDEALPLEVGARLAYRWRSPFAPKRLRLTLDAPSPLQWLWSASIPFVAGSHRVSVSDPGGDRSLVKYLFIQITESSIMRTMHIQGRVVLVNMMRYPLLYEVRSKSSETKQWSVVGSGELVAEKIGRTVITNMEYEHVFKVKFANHKTGWSGDIPLKECPKTNVPWLVKVPSDGDIPFVSVWCRVLRGRTDARILAAIWPLYILHSHLPLDTDVLVTTEGEGHASGSASDTQDVKYAPLLQSVPGRGTASHLYVPGTTSLRHSLTFQYRNIECAVTRDAVPLYYGVTDVSVFNTRVSVNNIDDVISDILTWLKTYGHNSESDWPYSTVVGHWSDTWKATMLQPKCDVTIQYQPVVAGGGCSLEMQVAPLILLCNAASVALTLRGHNAAPLCKIEPGTAMSPTSALLENPFFMSIELGREMFVSCPLEVSHSQPSRYGSPPPGTVARDRPAHFAIQCQNKVALLTLYYEIKNNINVFGISCTYVLINKLGVDVYVAPVAIPNTTEMQDVFRPTTFTKVQPTQINSTYGMNLCKFTLHGRWIGSDVSELQLYLNLALDDRIEPMAEPVPVRLCRPPARRAISLRNKSNKSMAIVVCQVKEQSRWITSLSWDPCPQFVVRNKTTQPLLVAQPHLNHDPFNYNVSIVADCENSKWHCLVPPGTYLHYSTPAYCQRHPATTTAHNESPWNYLTIGKFDLKDNCVWSAPVPAVGGEQLVQLPGNHIVKLKVKPHPHSTLIDLHNIDHLDISASDIRKRLDSAQPLIRSHSEEPTQSEKRIAIANQHDNMLFMAASHDDDFDEEDLDAESEVVLQTIKIVPLEAADPHSDSASEDEDDVSAGGGVSDHYTKEDITQKSETHEWKKNEFISGVFSGLVVQVAAAPDVDPLIALHVDRVAVHVTRDHKGTTTILWAASELQVDNMQYESGLYDFAVVAASSGGPMDPSLMPPLFTMLSEYEPYEINEENSRFIMRLVRDRWQVCGKTFTEITEIDLKVGPLGLYIEDAYVHALERLIRPMLPRRGESSHGSTELNAIAKPLRLRLLRIQPLDLTLTLHTAVRIYIALDQSPLSLSAFELRDMMTSSERLTHALTVHYLSATLLGAGWVVGGLELLGAPGAVAARVGGASGGVRGVASAAAAALLRSLAACAGSLARNLDLLAGDEEHSRRAAAARRAPPSSLLAGLYAGATNFAINLLGAVGGLAHHPLVSVGVGESMGGARALRRGLLGALAKPLSATADLVAFAGHGLLAQTGWDPHPQPRVLVKTPDSRHIWQTNCVRWVFHLPELEAIAGFQVLLESASVLLILTEKLLVMVDPDSERIVETIEFKYCTVAPYRGHIIEMSVYPIKRPKDPREESDTYQVSAAMARVAQYTGGASGGAGGGGGGAGGAGAQRRVMLLLPAPARAHALYSVLSALIQHNEGVNFTIL